MPGLYRYTPPLVVKRLPGKPFHTRHLATYSTGQDWLLYTG